MIKDNIYYEIQMNITSINENMREAKEIKRSNALIPEHNRKEVQKYEES